MNTRSLIILAFACWISQTTFAQTEAYKMTIGRMETSKNVIEPKTIKTIEQAKPQQSLLMKANLYPNPSNLGKVRLSVENLPNEPIFIQVFNEENELIKEGVINGRLGASIEHTLKFPDTSGNYSIKLSDSDRILQNLELKIL